MQRIFLQSIAKLSTSGILTRISTPLMSVIPLNRLILRYICRVKAFSIPKHNKTLKAKYFLAYRNNEMISKWHKQLGVRIRLNLCPIVIDILAFLKPNIFQASILKTNPGVELQTAEMLTMKTEAEFVFMLENKIGNVIFNYY